MKSLIFQDPNNTVNVEYVTDLIAPNAENFTVMDVKGLNAVEEGNAVRLRFQRLPYNLKAFKDFATANNLKLTMIDYNKSQTATVLVDFSNPYQNGGLGIDNV